MPEANKELKDDVKSLRDIAHWTKLVEMEFKRISEEVRRKEARVTNEMLYQIADRMENRSSSGDARVLDELKAMGMTWLEHGEARFKDAGEQLLSKLSALRADTPSQPNKETT